MAFVLYKMAPIHSATDGPLVEGENYERRIGSFPSLDDAKLAVGKDAGVWSELDQAGDERRWLAQGSHRSQHLKYLIAQEE